MPITSVSLRRMAEWFKLSRVSRLMYLVLLIVLGSMAFGDFPETPDGQVDYLILRAGWDGTDPTVPTIELAERYNLPGSYTTLGVSRTPGFYLLNSPQLLGLEVGIWAIRAINVAAAIAIGFIVSCMWSVRWWVITLPVVLIGWGWIAWATPGLLWAAFIAWTWMLISRSDGWWYGIPLGVAVAARAWPAILVVALFTMDRRRSAIGAASAAAVLSVGGLFLPGVTIERTIRSLTDDGWAFAHGSNLSLSTLLARVGIPTVITIAVGIIFVASTVHRMGPQRGFGVAMAVGLLISPIAWFHYWSATAPMWPRIFPIGATPQETTSTDSEWAG